MCVHTDIIRVNILFMKHVRNKLYSFIDKPSIIRLKHYILRDTYRFDIIAQRLEVLRFVRIISIAAFDIRVRGEIVGVPSLQVFGNKLHEREALFVLFTLFFV